ncbi:MAG: type II secretion system minor pseudopilin GspI [Kordiimonadaceae bacterium]|nr:type II secretion system minor pseudopilin GspI [Kordiimonadaceae bacterium]
MIFGKSIQPLEWPCAATLGLRKNAACDEGFSLIEALVALAIFSFAAIALLSVQSASARAVVALEDKLLAEIVAENVMISYLVEGNNARKGTTELAGRRWRWKQSRPRPAGQEFDQFEISVSTADSTQVIYSITRLVRNQDGS